MWRSVKLALSFLGETGRLTGRTGPFQHGHRLRCGLLALKFCGMGRPSRFSLKGQPTTSMPRNTFSMESSDSIQS
jgi:hypothetical protein